MEDLEGKYFRELTFLCLCIAFVFAKEGNNQALYGCSKPRQKKQKKDILLAKCKHLHEKMGQF
jgi:hypothetical protein